MERTSTRELWDAFWLLNDVVGEILPPEVRFDDRVHTELETLDSRVLRALPFVRCGGAPFLRDEVHEADDALRTCVRGLVIAIVEGIPFEPTEQMAHAIAASLNPDWVLARDNSQPIVFLDFNRAPPAPPAGENYQIETRVRRSRGRGPLRSLVRSYRLFLRRFFAVGQAG
jgi:hypothetical protein